MSIFLTLTKQSHKIAIGIIVILSAALTLAAYAHLKQAKPETNAAIKIYHVGILSGVDSYITAADGFKSKMSELGYVEGKNIVYDEEHVNLSHVDNKRVLRRFIDEKVDLMFVFPTLVAMDAKEVTAGTNIPVVFDYTSVEGNNIIESSAHPGGNLTGVSFDTAELAAKRFELLHELMPKLKRVWVIYDPEYPTSQSAALKLRIATKSTGVTLMETQIKNVTDLQTVLAERDNMHDIGVDAMLVMPEVIVQSPEGWKLVTEFAKKHKLPIGGNAGFEADQGAVFSYTPNIVESGKLGAPIAHKILQGENPGSIPVVSPESVLRFNYTLAKELGLTVTEGFLARATEIIKK